MEDIVTQLQDIMGWTEYEAIAYETLVREGPLEASEVVTRSEISKGKEYDVLNKLADENIAVTQGTHPQKFNAQEPRVLIEEKEDEYEEKIDNLKQRLGTAYEMRQESNRPEDSVWMSRGRSGLARKVRESFKNVEESIYMKLFDPRWLEDTDIRDLSNLKKQEIDVKLLCFDGRPNLDKIATEGVPVWKSDSVEASYCIFDEETVAMEVQSGNIGMGYPDRALARVFTNDFQDSISNAEKVTVDA